MAVFTWLTILCIAAISSMTWADTEFCQGPCPEGWVAYNQRCFQYDPTDKTWIDAEIHCLSMGGNMASTWSAEDEQFLKDLQKQAGHDQPFWIGLTDITWEGTWLWTDGHPVKYTNWNSGEPNNIDNEDCAIANSGGGWNDLGCDSSSHASMCEIRYL